MAKSKCRTVRRIANPQPVICKCVLYPSLDSLKTEKGTSPRQDYSFSPFLVQRFKMSLACLFGPLAWRCTIKAPRRKSVHQKPNQLKINRHFFRETVYMHLYPCQSKKETTHSSLIVTVYSRAIIRFASFLLF